MSRPALAYQDWPPVSACRPSVYPCGICLGPAVWDGPGDNVHRCYGCYYVCWMENGVWVEWLRGTEFRSDSVMRAKLAAALRESEGWWWPPKELFQGF